MLPTRQLAHLASLDNAGRDKYFFDYARYRGDAPHLKYAIRIGSTTLFSDDTYDLRMKFNRAVGQLRRKFRKPLKGYKTIRLTT